MKKRKKEKKEQVSNQKVETATEEGDCENTEDRDSPLRLSLIHIYGCFVK